MGTRLQIHKQIAAYMIVYFRPLNSRDGHPNLRLFIDPEVMR